MGSFLENVKAIRNRIDRVFMAVGFAEAGEVETAKRIMDEGGKKQKRSAEVDRERERIQAAGARR